MELISKSKPFGKEDREIKFHFVAVMVAGCFFISRATFFDGMLPAGIALVTVLISISTLNFYLLPVVLVGLASLYGSGSILAEMGAACCCGFLFLVASKIGFALWQKAAIAGMSILIAESIYHIASSTLYPSALRDIATEGVLVAGLCVVFHIFFQLALRKKSVGTFEMGLAATVVMIVLILAGLELPLVLLRGVMILTILMGCLMGLTGGLVTGITAALCMAALGGQPDMIGILALGGLAAGYGGVKNKNLAAVSFALLLLILNALKLSESFTVPYDAPVVAAAVVILLPQKWVVKWDVFIHRFLQSGSYEEKQKQSRTIQTLQEAKTLFDELSGAFQSSANERAVIAHQFRGVSQILDKLTRNIKRPEPWEEGRFVVESAGAGYGRNLGVSGDSYLWEDLDRDRFAIILSDGMGKGEKAARESNLVVTTVIKLLKAGLDVELVLKMLNSILLIKTEDEMLSTVDLGIINKKTGKIKFYKIGAAPTFIKRRNTIEQIKIPAMPLGIIDGLKVDYVAGHLRPGDQLIMISDGIIDSRRGDLTMDWLADTAESIKSKDPQTMCDLIMNRAVENYGLKEKDDLTVLSVRLT